MYAIRSYYAHAEGMLSGRSAALAKTGMKAVATSVAAEYRNSAMRISPTSDTRINVGVLLAICHAPVAAMLSLRRSGMTSYNFV